MFMIDLLHPKPTPVKLKIEGKLDLSSFNPHGISVYTDETGDVQIPTIVKQVIVCIWIDPIIVKT